MPVNTSRICKHRKQTCEQNNNNNKQKEQQTQTMATKQNRKGKEERHKSIDSMTQQPQT